MSRARRLTLTLAVLTLYALHQDFWFWRTAEPLLLGYVPIGLAYHAGFCLVTTLLMAVLVRQAWPRRLEEEVEGHEPSAPGASSR